MGKPSDSNVVHGHQPDTLSLIAQAIGTQWAAPPYPLVDFKARNKALCKAARDIDKSEHLRRLSQDAPANLRDTLSYKYWLCRFSRPVHMGQKVWGVYVLKDTSHVEDGMSVQKVGVEFYPTALIANPCLNDDPPGLDIELTYGLWELVSQYDGPGFILPGEGDEFPQGLILTVFGEPNQELDAHLVGRGLAKILNSGEFDRKFSAIVKQTELNYQRSMKR